MNRELRRLRDDRLTPGARPYGFSKISRMASQL
jgi:hypothetical protein